MKRITKFKSQLFGRAAHFILLLMVFSGFSLFHPNQIFACPPGVTCRDGCDTDQQCLNGYTCQLYSEGAGNRILGLSAVRCGSGEGSALLGGIYVPVGVNKFGWGVDPVDGTRIGLINFVSLLLRIFTFISLLWFMFNIIIGGYLFITSSTDSGTMSKFKESLYYSLIGLFLIATAYLIAALVGSIFFGNAGFIIRPALFSATQL